MNSRLAYDDIMPQDASIRITLLTGPGAGREASFTQSPITFGRDPDNTLMLAESFVSRQHGQIEKIDGGWDLVNKSPNGTRVNRSNVTTKPRRLKSGDVVAIADTQLLRIAFGEDTGADAQANSAAAAAPAESGKQPLSKRTKLWIGLGVWWVGMLLALAFFMTLGDSGGGNVAPNAGKELSSDEIRAAIEAPPAAQVPNQTIARKRLTEARTLTGSLQSAPGNVFKAYAAYRDVLAFSGKDRFEDPLDELRYQDVTKRLTEEVIQRYQTAMNRYRGRQYDAAARDLAEITELYNDPGTLIFDNAQRHAITARDNANR